MTAEELKKIGKEMLNRRKKLVKEREEEIKNIPEKIAQAELDFIIREWNNNEIMLKYCDCITLSVRGAVFGGSKMILQAKPFFVGKVPKLEEIIANTTMVLGENSIELPDYVEIEKVFSEIKKKIDDEYFEFLGYYENKSDCTLDIIFK